MTRTSNDTHIYITVGRGDSKVIGKPHHCRMPFAMLKSSNEGVLTWQWLSIQGQCLSIDCRSKIYTFPYIGIIFLTCVSWFHYTIVGYNLHCTMMMSEEWLHDKEKKPTNCIPIIYSDDRTINNQNCCCPSSTDTHPRRAGFVELRASLSMFLNCKTTP